MKFKSCQDCDGTGACSYCSGEGVVENKTCGDCEGSGECKNCGGNAETESEEE